MMAARFILASLLPVVQSGRFRCSDFEVPPAPGDSVRDLHPGHVGYVMVMGDSITAAFAARSTLLEARDISWSIGVGEKDQLTLPYIGTVDVIAGVGGALSTVAALFDELDRASTPSPSRSASRRRR